MLIRQRSCAYIAVAIICIWSFVTFYFTVYRSPVFKSRRESREQMHPVQSAAAIELKNKIDKIQVDIIKQKAENEVLLRMLQNGSISIGAVEKRSPPSNARHSEPIAILVIACNRPNAVKNHLDQLFKLRPSKEQFPVIVSQDCMHEETAKVLKDYGDQIVFMQQPDQSEIKVPPKQKKLVGYYKIARHYRWALNQTFYKHGFNAAIITEDDLDISQDFFEYFTATYRLLELDSSLWCVSAWNDNGKINMIEEKPELLYRTDFFPGLGWMLKRNLWEELESKWPEAYWDDWMRRPEQRKDRACIRPEISRTAMSLHGKLGVSRGLYFDKHLKWIKLNNATVPFTKMDLTYLLKDKFDEQFVKNVYSWPSITQSELMSGHFADGKPLPDAVRLTYADRMTYKSTAKMLKLMDDFRAGVPRTAYRGIVPFMYGKIRVYLSPPSDWKGYDPTWT